MTMIKVKCIRDDVNSARVNQLVLNKVYIVHETDDTCYSIFGETWAKSRFIFVKDDDYEPAPVTLKSPNRASNNEEDSQELMAFFSRPSRPDYCICEVFKKGCKYHKESYD